MPLTLYQQWLGITTPSKHPNYFQLLEVEVQPTDASTYKTEVIASVKAHLFKLDKLDAGSQQDALDKMRQRIIRAGQTLIDPKARQEYIHWLQQEDQSFRVPQPVKSTPSAKSISPKAPSQKTANPSLLPPTRKPKQSSVSREPTPAATTPNAPMPSSAAVHSAVPADDSIPMAKPVPPAAVPVFPDSQLPTHSPPSALVAPAESNSTDNNFDGGQQKTRSEASLRLQKRRKSQSIQRTIAALFMLIVGGGSIYVLVTMLPQLTQIADQQNPETEAPTNIPSTNLTAGETTANKPPSTWDKTNREPNTSWPGEFNQTPADNPRNNRINQSTIGNKFTNNLNDPSQSLDPVKEVQSQPNRPVSENMEPKNNVPGNSSKSDQSMQPQPPVSVNPTNDSPDMGNDDPFAPDINSANNSDDPFAPDKMAMSEPNDPFAPDVDVTDDENVPETQSANPKPLNQMQILGLRRNLTRLHRSLKRRDKATTDLLIPKGQYAFDSLTNGGKTSLLPAQQRLLTHFKSIRETKDRLQGFWNQVTNASMSLSGARNVEVGDRTLGFLEANSNGVLLRNSGENIFYGYSFMPPGIAVAMAELGSIADIPTWRLQLAAFYSLYLDDNPDYVEKIEDLISQSEADGHDGSLLREFRNTDFSDVGLSLNRVPMPSKNELSELLQEINPQYSELEADSVAPQRAEAIVQLLLNQDPSSQEQSIAAMDLARQLAIQAGDAYSVEDAILELDYLADIQQAEMFAESMLEVGKQNLEPVQARRLLETTIPFLKSEEFESVSRSTAKKLVTGLKKLARKHGFIDAQRRLSQL